MDDGYGDNCIKVGCRMYLLQTFDTRKILLVILLVKVVLNWLILSVNRKVLQSLIGYFCISLSLMDFALFTSMVMASFLNNYIITGAQNQICLHLQFFSDIYDVLHVPICLLAGLDYFVNLHNLSKSLNESRTFTYLFTVFLLWIGAIVYVCIDYKIHVAWQVILDPLLYQCDIPFSNQSLLLSLLILIILVLVSIYCWSDLTSLVRSLNVDSYLKEIVLWSSHPAAQLQPLSSKKQVLANIILCFSLTWMPFILLQLAIVLIWAPLPAYIDLNVPWLCFINSFLIGTVYWLKHRDIPPDVISFIPDGFCHWDCCKLQKAPFVCSGNWVHDNKILMA
ncbi:probable G-protein coupled receptor 160 [Mobula birostris]|uniref:probable G-protein coupled receptor 160 n=1 Tax=Mobula birostris TaxID=1983395 RepID=UPI003B283321